MSDGPPQIRKKRRISRACDYCHRRSKRCRASRDSSRCQSCVAFDQPCTFDRPQKQRGARRRIDHDDQASTSHHQAQASEALVGGDGVASAPTASRPPSNSEQRDLFPAEEHPPAAPSSYKPVSTLSWRAPGHYDHAMILDLVELFFEIVYPIFPFFHQPSFVRRTSRAEYVSDKSLFCVTMAVCALVSARIRDGAVFNPRWDVHRLQDPPPEVYCKEALRQLGSKQFGSDINTLRAHAILALGCIQDGKVREMHGHLGRYHTIVATEGLHDESNWPTTVGVVEREERRRLFWSIYTLDIFTSIVWGGVIRSREYQSNVSYPSEVDDDMFDDSGFASTDIAPSILGTSPGTGQPNALNISWLAGRNFVIDLYRVMEHVLMRLPARRSRAPRQTLIDNVLQVSDSLSQEAVLDSVVQMYADLPQCFKATNPMTSKPRMDRFGFQAADIIATVQLLRMVVLIATGASIFERCQIANEVVNAFIAIPTAYHHAISVPLLFHLGVIGQILATTLEQPLSEKEYSSIRDVMMAMAQLLSTLEGLHASRGASQRLRDQITRVDEYMTMQRRDTRTQTCRPSSTAPTPQSVRETSQATPPSAFSSTAVDEMLATSPFHLPSELLGDFSQIFDFSQLP